MADCTYKENIYKDIAKRTGGNIYIGVVGPVRTGKSTFIKKMLEKAIIPSIADEYDKKRATDELPQSASGKTVMTTEPKFIPNEAVRVSLEDEVELNVRLIDCVGYLVDGALGTQEDGESRMVSTPWNEEVIPFEKAAEIGTEKVIREHSTIAVLVSADGSFGDIPRESFIPAEERAARELTECGKPYVILLNSAHPESKEAHELAESLEKKYGAPVALVNCLLLSGEDINEILRMAIKEFPLTTLTFDLPRWCEALPDGHRIYSDALSRIEKFTEGVRTLGDVERADRMGLISTSINVGDGSGEFSVPLSREDFLSAASELSGIEIDDECAVLKSLIELAQTAREHEKISSALDDVNEKGYGIVMPCPEELVLDEPKITKHAGAWGVKVGASASSIHMIKTNIKTEICPVVGSEEQSEEVVKYLLGELREAPEKVWQSNMFGKSLYDLVKDGMNAKLLNIPDDSREKIAETLERVVNEGANGLICILL